MTTAAHVIAIRASMEQPLLADVAAFEVASREKHYPGMIDRGEIAQLDAAADLYAWRAIARLFAEQQTVSEGWEPLFAAADRALASRDKACAEKPGDPRLEARRVRVRWVGECLRYHRAFMLAGPLPPYPSTPVEAM